MSRSANVIPVGASVAGLDYYAILGVSPSCTQDELRAAYIKSCEVLTSSSD